MSGISNNPHAKIVVVDSEPDVVREIRQALEQAGYADVRELTELNIVSAYLDENSPDLVILDLCMSSADSCAVLEQICRGVPDDCYLPVLVVSATADTATRLRAVQAGAKGFLVKPVDLEELTAYVHSLLDTRFQNRRAREARDLLEALVQRRTNELRQAHIQMAERLRRVASLRDDPSGQHTNRMARLSALIARELHLSPEDTELIMRAAPLHDLGNVAAGDQSLRATGGLTREERASMREHAIVGAELLSGASSDLLRMAEVIALHHHERWDGQGYPHGLAGEDIPLEARIVAVADAFDALTHARAYKEAYSSSEALIEIERESGWQFDPTVVAALVRIQRREMEQHTLDATSVPTRPEDARLEGFAPDLPVVRHLSES